MPIAATEEEYVAGFNQAKEERAKILIQSLPKGVPSGDVIKVRCKIVIVNMGSKLEKSRIKPITVDWKSCA